MEVGIIILAAGESKRMGIPKQLLDVNGKSLLLNVIDSALDTSCYPVTVVVGAHKKAIVPVLKDLPINIVDNPRWESGMAGSIKMGMVGSYLLSKTIEAVIITTSDMPEVSSSVLKTLIEKARATNANIITSKYNDAIGVPALIKRPFFEELLNLEGDQGARQIFKKYKNELVSIDFNGGAIDLDTKEDYYNYVNSQN
ncbi:nucleotidyltransferase family protein [Jiulongibacter sediminis]|uniref:MobA-like NTP transferase domain-containing protein n=1 Tax=Jiulongibacter sediminis TaxID=1605367 RepID=A0A0P7BQE4_9BACT|nr:nucleotidyltransferase family protein [Jiulongibacter sediminis]KPM49385.1 hypothetical protein AFM12_01845 [Jiulongibacter sediminis]TBX26434.1 hypothetical protein TK44_01850 [Jiulongibacter sediminis]